MDFSMNKEKARALIERIFAFRDCLDEVRIAIRSRNEDVHCSFDAEHNVKAKRALRGVMCACEDVSAVLRYLDEYVSKPDAD